MIRSWHWRPRPGSLISLMALAPLAFASMNCATIANSMAKGIAKKSVERDFVLPSGAGQAFADCFGRRGGACEALGPAAASARVGALDTSTPEPLGPAGNRDLMGVVGAGLARDVLNHPVQRKINDLYNHLRGVAPARGITASFREEVPTLRLEMEELDDYLMDVEAATIAGGWDALADEAVKAAGAAGPGALDPGAAADFRRRAFLSAYFKAYFRSGQFYQFSLDPSGLEERAKEQLKKSLPFLTDEDIDELFKELEERFNLEKDAQGRYPLFGTLGTTGFVARGGTSYSFPSLEAQFDPTRDRVIQVSEIDFTVVGSDLIRVLLHAIFDAHHGLPAVSTATGVGIQHPDALKANGPGVPGHISEDDFGKVEEFASRVEGATGAAIGRVVRGVSWIALNNEALAALIETTVAVAVRKFAEKAAWCWFSCFGEGAPERASPLLATQRAERIRIVVSGPAALMESD